MSDIENEDEQYEEVEVELYALADDDDLDLDAAAADDFAEEEEPLEAAQVDDAVVESTGLTGEISIDFGDQAEAILEDVKSDSTYELHAHTDAESFDPEEAPANAIVETDEVVGFAEEGASISDGDEVDELPESIEIPEEEAFVYIQEDDEEAALEKAARSRRRLRNLLIFFIVVLILVGAAIGVFVWRNNTPPDVKQTDPDAMQASKAGTTVEVFQSINADQIPDLVTFFGMTPEEAAEASGSTIALDAEGAPATDAAIPELASIRNAWVVGKNGDIAVSISFGLDKDNKIIYTLATFDLDAYGVADAKFDELAASKVVASSILAGVGLDGSTVDSSEITIIQKPDAVTSRDTTGKEVAEFSGSTNLDKAPKEWKLTETYDHTAGASLGDNSVIRTLSIDLR